MERKSGQALWYSFLLLILLLGLVRIVMSHRGTTFLLEVLGVVGLVLLSLIGFAGLQRNWGRAVLFGAFILYIINLILLWLFTSNLYIILLLVALVGFFSSLPKTAPSKKAAAADSHDVVHDQPKKTVEEPQKVATQYTPGKYVASKSSNVYHEPTCDWAKKIQKSRQVWFIDKKEAYQQGFRKHSCVQ